MNRKPGDKLYRIGPGTLEVATFLNERIAPGASVPSYIVRYSNGREASTSIDFWYASELEAWHEYLRQTQESFPSLRAQYRESEKALMQAHREANRVVTIIGELVEREVKSAMEQDLTFNQDVVDLDHATKEQRLA